MIAFVERRVGPAIARDDVAIEFDGDAVRLHAEVIDECGESEWGRNAREVSIFAVDAEFHAVSVLSHEKFAGCALAGRRTQGAGGSNTRTGLINA